MKFGIGSIRNFVGVRFTHEGPREDGKLSKQTKYLASVDGGPRSEFRSPWSDAELDEVIAVLRQTESDKPTIARVREMGLALGTEIHKIEGLAARLSNGPVTVYWQLENPELARIPWEIATSTQPPYLHLLHGNVSFVRKVPSVVPDPPAVWPTGRDETLRLLFVYSEGGGQVPQAEHAKALRRICDEYGVDFHGQEITEIEDLNQLCLERDYHFVHILAHGARRGGAWGIRLRRDVASGAEVALALRARGNVPALVTLAVCDSANEGPSSFGSVAYELHAHGVPFVIGSQFRLLKPNSTISAARVYESVLGGHNPLALLDAERRALAAQNNEAWANEVFYSRYREEALNDLLIVASQQGALRRAQALKKLEPKDDEERKAIIGQLRAQEDRLRGLARTLDEDRARRRPELAETYGLLGSLQRRVAELGSEGAQRGGLDQSLRSFRAGFDADLNSHYCGINVIHLCKRLGRHEEIPAIEPIVRHAARADEDLWAAATAGELEVYAGRAGEAEAAYRRFIGAVEAANDDRKARRKKYESAARQLEDIVKLFDDQPGVQEAARGCLQVLNDAIEAAR